MYITLRSKDLYQVLSLYSIMKFADSLHFTGKTGNPSSLSELLLVVIIPVAIISFLTINVNKIVDIK